MLNVRLFDCFVIPDAFTQEFVIGLANFGGFIIIKEGKKRVAATPCDPRDSVKQCTWEDNRSARWRLKASRSVLGEAHLSSLELGVQVDRNGKTAVRCALGRIISVRPEMPAVLSRIAGDDVALHACGFERM